LPRAQENRGEIDAMKGSTRIVSEKDTRDFHIHTSYSDGSNSIEEMVKAAQDRDTSTWRYGSLSFEQDRKRNG
jgi:DNA polymerase (family 10)